MKKTLLALSFLASLTATAQTTFKVGDVVYQTTSPKTVQTYKFESKNTEVNIPQTVSHEGKEYTVTAIGEESFSWSKLQKNYTSSTHRLYQIKGFCLHRFITNNTP